MIVNDLEEVFDAGIFECFEVSGESSSIVQESDTLDDLFNMAEEIIQEDKNKNEEEYVRIRWTRWDEPSFVPVQFEENKSDSQSSTSKDVQFKELLEELFGHSATEDPG